MGGQTALRQAGFTLEGAEEEAPHRPGPLCRISLLLLTVPRYLHTSMRLSGICHIGGANHRSAHLRQLHPSWVSRALLLQKSAQQGSEHSSERDCSLRQHDFWASNQRSRSPKLGTRLTIHIVVASWLVEPVENFIGSSWMTKLSRRKDLIWFLISNLYQQTLEPVKLSSIFFVSFIQ